MKSGRSRSDSKAKLKSSTLKIEGESGLKTDAVLPAVIQQAVDLILRLLGDSDWQERGYLPGVRQLARMAGCSHYTMWKALRHCAEIKLFEITPGRRVRLGKSQAKQTEDNSKQELERSRYKWEKLLSQMEREIIGGIFKPGEALPSLKELQVKYGVSYLTLKKALEELEVRGVLKATGKAFALLPVSASAHSNRLIYFAWGDERGSFRFENPFDHDFQSSFENECARLRIAIEKVAYRFEGNALKFMQDRVAVADLNSLCRNAFGFVVRTVCTRDVVPYLIPLLATYRKPLVVLDELGSEALIEMRNRFSQLAVFRSTISETSAWQMGLYLAGLGHKHIAFLSPHHRTIWSLNRLKGLQAAYRSAGNVEGVSVYTLELPYQLPFEEEEGEPARVLMAALKESKEGWNPQWPALSPILHHLQSAIRQSVWQEYLLEQFSTILATALCKTEVTAWVAVDDDSALLALEFLRRQGLKPPEHLSLVGFDDTAEGARNDLTSYNFNFPGVIHSMLMHILNPPNLSVNRKREPLEIEGRIVNRGSVADLRSK